jgi:hypothetical protein
MTVRFGVGRQRTRRVVSIDSANQTGRRLFDNISLGVEVLRAVSGMAALFVPWLAYRLHKPDRVAKSFHEKAG